MNRKREPKERVRDWVAILYPDNDRHIKAITTIEKLKYPAIWILHDKDEKIKDEIEEEEEEQGDIDFKKAHWHVLFCFENARMWHQLANDLDIEPHLLRFRKDFKRVGKSNESYMRYMVHRGEFDKYQYPEGNVKGDDKLKQRLHIACENYNVDEKDRVDLLLDFIDSADDKITIRSFMRYANAKGFYGTVRQGSGLWGRAIDERNMEIEMQQRTEDFLKTANPFTEQPKKNSKGEKRKWQF